MQVKKAIIPREKVNNQAWKVTNPKNNAQNIHTNIKQKVYNNFYNTNKFNVHINLHFYKNYEH